MLVTLKSNMDRFIDTLRLPAVVIYISLKSNMDRFIVLKHSTAGARHLTLKSNMDRFIARVVNPELIAVVIFKIQYG